MTDEDKNALAKMFAWMIFLLTLLGIIVYMWGCLAVMQTKDEYNPCKPGQYQDSVICNYWKNNYPKEYKRYLKRRQKMKHKSRMPKSSF